MQSKAILAIAAFAAIASTGAFANEADGPASVQFQSTRTRAEVLAEARQANTVSSFGEVGYVAAAPALKSTVDVRAVRADAAEGIRLGQIGYGETGSF